MPRFRAPSPAPSSHPARTPAPAPARAPGLAGRASRPLDVVPLTAAGASRSAARSAALGPVRRVAVIGNHVPRQCGIATFTRDVANGLRGVGAAVRVWAMEDGGTGEPYPAGVETVDATSRAAHRRAGEAIDAWAPDAVLVEHEFGIFGGASGLWLLDALAPIRAPITVTLHTVLEEPTDEQRVVLRGLARRAARFVVMARAGAAILAKQGIAPERIAVVPHGAPDRAWERPSDARARLGWTEAPTVLTFGLLSPGKGIEHLIDALPRVLRDAPNARYVLLGATHPHLLAREGERYREGLVARAERLGVAHALRMIPRFVSNDELCDALAAADVYVTPYGNPQQITSGTLAYALALGKPVVSTPYVHAREVLPPEQIVPHGDPAALGERIAALLADPAALEALSRRTWIAARGTVWSAVAEQTLDALGAAPAAAAPLVAAE